MSLSTFSMVEGAPLRIPGVQTVGEEHKPQKPSMIIGFGGLDFSKPQATGTDASWMAGCA
jgi:hypothetical protein